MMNDEETDMNHTAHRAYKTKVMNEMRELASRLRDKVRVLDAMDRDTSCDYSYDLTDQLTSMRAHLDQLESAVVRAGAVNGD